MTSSGLFTRVRRLCDRLVRLLKRELPYYFLEPMTVAPSHISFPTVVHNTYLPTYATFGCVLDDPREQGSALNKDGQAFTFFKVTDMAEKRPEGRYFDDWRDFYVDVRHPRTAQYCSCHWMGFRLPAPEHEKRKWVVMAYPASVFSWLEPEGSLQKLMTLIYGDGSISSPVPLKPLPVVPRVRRERAWEIQCYDGRGLE